MRLFDVALIALLALLVLTGCKGPNHAAWTTLDTLQNLRKLTGQQLAAAAKAKHQDCVKQHGAKTPEYAACIKGHREALRQWQKNVRPALDSSVQITASALVIADKAKKKAQWLDLIKPGACALARAVKSWAHYFANKAASILSGLKLVEGVACE